ncbi:hypothetical protein Bca101_051823 [Brassica carinata]
MRSLSHHKSAHMADIKGKGIQYDDDEPILLTADDDGQVIKEFRMSLIGKILNPKKQNVEKLLQTMPTQWGVQDRVTANDLGNGRFLFNFTSEEELNEVLSKGPFHYNYCMFVLVQWEPIIHDDYPWIIPFWVVMSGIPLHLWTVKNLKSIGGRLAHVDTDSIQVAEGRMLIDIYSRLPLKFTKKVKAPEGEEVTIQIKYEMLFKHCSTCGSLTPEKGYCPLTVQALVGTNPNVRADVFVRVQIPQEQLNHQPSQGGNKNSNDRSHMSHDMRSRLAGYKGSYAVRGELTDNKHGRDEYRSWHGKETYQPRHQNVNRHADRIVRTRDDISNRYGNSRSRYGPYDRKKDLTWREKQRENKPWKKDNDSLPHEPNSIGNSRYAGSDVTTEGEQDSYADLTSKDGIVVTMHQRRKIASTIVTPSRALVQSTENVTYRSQGLARTISFSPTASVVKEDAMVIEALSGMDITTSQDDGATEAEIKDDDLLGLDLMEMEAEKNQTNTAERVQEVALFHDRHRSKKSGTKRNVPLGVQSKMSQLLRRGSPAARSGRRSRVGHHGSTRKLRTGSSKGESTSNGVGLMGSKYPSERHP